MPSIPQSLLWISLVVLWLFVLVPMLISKRDAVRRTSDVALATRVLNGDSSSRLLKRGGPATGHRSDPNWKPEEDSADDDLADLETQAEQDQYENQDQDQDQDADSDELRRRRPVVMKVAPVEHTEPDYLDVDVVEDSGALPAGSSAQMPEPALLAVDGQAGVIDEDDLADETEFEAANAGQGTDQDDIDEDELGDRYEYVEDSSGLEPGEDDDEESPARVAPAGSRRQRFDTRTAAAVSARKYTFRKRVLMMMAVILVGSATAAFEVAPSAWWLCATATVVTVLYLAYLRRQTRIEGKVRRRRMQRMARARLGVENSRDREYEVVPSRLRRPGAVVLEIDDEDPVFEHLENAMALRTFGWPRDLPRAVGE